MQPTCFSYTSILIMVCLLGLCKAKTGGMLTSPASSSPFVVHRHLSQTLPAAFFQPFVEWGHLSCKIWDELVVHITESKGGLLLRRCRWVPQVTYGINCLRGDMQTSWRDHVPKTINCVGKEKLFLFL